MGNLKAAELDDLAAKKWHDGEGLYFDKKKRGASWIYKFTLNGRAREMGLGKYPEISLNTARTLAAKARARRAEGADPVAERTAARRRGVTFEEAVREYWAAHCQGLARPNNWLSGMALNVFPHIGKKPVADLTPDDLIKFLKPIWKQEKTRKLRQWINAVVGYVSADDPRVDRDLVARVDNRLGAQAIKYDNLAAVPWQKIPDLWATLPNTLVGLSTKLLILTAVRVNCVVLAEWPEFDFKKQVWTIPAGRVKGWKFGFRVPLTTPMLDVLRTAKRLYGTTGFIFPSHTSKSGHLSNNAHRLWLHEHEWKDSDGRLATAHGYRTSFRNWADDALQIDFMLGEHIIQHMRGRGTPTEQAYFRTDQLDRRREVIEAWGEFVQTRLREKRALDAKRQDLDAVVSADGMTLQEVLKWSRDDARDDEEPAGMTPDEAAKWLRSDGVD